MFSREKLQRILRDNQIDFAKGNNANSYLKVVASNQAQNGGGGGDGHNKVFKAQDEQKSTDETLGQLEEVEDVGVIPDDRCLSDKDSKRVATGTLTLRSSKTPVESIFVNDSNFNAIKPNKNYAVEEQDDAIENSVEDTFQRAAGPREVFALLPVKGILNANPKRLKFSFKSLQFIYTIFFLGSSLILTLTMLKHLIKIGINAKNFVGLVFFGCVQFCTVLFISLAQRWPKIMRYWHRVESTFTQKPYEMPKKPLARRVHLSAILIIVGMAVEHALYLSSAVLSYKRGIELCATARNYTETVSFEDYVHRNYSYVFEILPYNMFIAIFILIVNGACTFVWNYMDLFIMMVSKGIAYRFEQITQRINKLKDKEIPESVFVEIREHYVKLCELLEFIDENLSGIILLSCMNNLYFVCYQLLNIFNKLRWPINYIYFWYSLLYLIARTAFVFLTAASINDQSKGGLPVLRRVSSRTWCVEVERLIFEMTAQTVALSGKKFYFLTRRLLFGMAGTIVTYELVLLQFDEPNRVKGLTALCA